MDDPSPTTTAAAPRLAGERIASVGRLASMARADAARIVAEHGGTWQPRADAITTLVVRGDEAAAGSVKDQLPAEVQERLAAGQAMLIDETQLWRRVGLVDERVGVSRLYTPALLAEMVEVEPRVIHRWHRRGYLAAVCEVRRLPYFDFSELRAARRLADLVHAGVSLTAIDRQMAELERLAPEVARPLADLSIVVEGGKIYLRRGGDLAEPSGQLLIDFEATSERDEAPEIANPLPDDLPPSAEELRTAALDLQDDGQPHQALELWRAVLLSGEAAPEDHFVAADLLYQLGDLAAARERYYMAIELDEDYDEARVNLGCVLAELGQTPLAADAFRGALARNAAFADAHYHLAHVLDNLDQTDEAAQHWQAFLELAPESPWADEARERLADSG